LDCHWSRRTGAKSQFGGLQDGFFNPSYHGFRLGTTKTAPLAPATTLPPIHAASTFALGAATAGASIFGAVGVRCSLGRGDAGGGAADRPIAGLAAARRASIARRRIMDSERSIVHSHVCSPTVFNLNGANWLLLRVLALRARRRHDLR
jgi:hypothetical protein